MHRNQNFKTSVVRLFFIFKVFFLCFYFFSFYLFADVVDLLLGFLPVKKFLRKYQWHRQFLAKFSWGNFAASFSCTFRSVFVHFSGLIDAITLIWVLVERSFPLTELEYKWSQFWSNVMMPEVEQRPTLNHSLGINGSRYMHWGYKKFTNWKQMGWRYFFRNMSTSDHNTASSNKKKKMIILTSNCVMSD